MVDWKQIIHELRIEDVKW